MSDLVELLRKEADAADEKSIKLREAIEALGVISAYTELGFPMKPKRLGRPPKLTVAEGRLLRKEGVLLKEIPVKASKKKGKKRKYTKRSTFWKKKK